MESCSRHILLRGQHPRGRLRIDMAHKSQRRRSLPKRAALPGECAEGLVWGVQMGRSQRSRLRSAVDMVLQEDLWCRTVGEFLGGARPSLRSRLAFLQTHRRESCAVCRWARRRRSPRGSRCCSVGRCGRRSPAWSRRAGLSLQRTARTRCGGQPSSSGRRRA